MFPIKIKITPVMSSANASRTREMSKRSHKSLTPKYFSWRCRQWFLCKCHPLFGFGKALRGAEWFIHIQYNNCLNLFTCGTKATRNVTFNQFSHHKAVMKCEKNVIPSSVRCLLPKWWKELFVFGNLHHLRDDLLTVNDSDADDSICSRIIMLLKYFKTNYSQFSHSRFHIMKRMIPEWFCCRWSLCNAS